jgi:septal ring factor EnvC (AmiA/AmiB activator)
MSFSVSLQLPFSVATIHLLKPAVLAIALLGGCVGQQADTKQMDKNLQQRTKQSDEELAQTRTRARLGQEIATLREQELPQLRNELERAQHQVREILKEQDDLKHRITLLERQKSSGMETSGATTESRLDSLDVVIGKILLHVDALEKRLEALEKR